MTGLTDRLQDCAQWCLVEGNGDDECRQCLIAAAGELDRLTAELDALRERVAVLGGALGSANDAFLSANPFVPNGSDADFVLQTTWAEVRAALQGAKP